MTIQHADPAEILRLRAQALARKRDDSAAPGTLLELLEFTLAHERYAIESRFISEVHTLEELTPLPAVPESIRGIVNLRGRILPVLDLKKFFELPEHGLTDLHRIVVVRGHDLELGLLADTVVGLRHVALESLQPTLPTLTGIRADYLKGVSDARLVVLDLDRVLSDPKIIVHDDVD